MTATTAIVQVEADPACTAGSSPSRPCFMIGTAPVGGPLLGWLADATGGRVPIVIGAVVCLAAAAWGQVASTRAEARRLPRT